MNEGKRFTRHRRLVSSRDISFPDFQGTWANHPVTTALGHCVGGRDSREGRPPGQGRRQQVSPTALSSQGGNVKDKSRWEQPRFQR